MKKQIDVETILSSFTPRGPSAKLEVSLFGPRKSPQVEAKTLQFNWLAPACAAVMLFTTGLTQPDLEIFNHDSPDLVTAGLSNQQVAAYLPTGFQPRANGVPAESFEWTNGAGLPCSIPSLPGRKGSN